MQTLAKGQNMPWPGQVVRIEVQAHSQCDVSALILGTDEKVRSSADLVFYNQPVAPGVQLQPGPPQTLTVTLGLLPTERLACVLSVDPDQPAMGASPPPTVRLLAGTEQVAQFVPSGLSTERAIVACELYRRAGAWKVRAVGQGYPGGLAELVRAHGIEVDDDPAPPPGPASAHPATIEAQQRLFGHCGAIMDDASRATASLQSTRDFAESNLHQALESLLDDPRLRVGDAADEARQRAHLEHDDLVARATANHRRDMAQLAAELRQFECQLPAPMARWTEQPWQAWQPPRVRTVGIRLGDLTLADAPELRVPLLVASPLRRPLWIDAENGGPDNAATMLRAVLTRLLACYPDSGVVVNAIDPAGRADPLAPIGRPGCQVQTEPAAVTLDAARSLLTELSRHVDRLEMALGADLLDTVDARERIVVIHDFPTGLDDGALALIRHLLDVGGRFAVQFVLTGSEGSATGPVAAGLFRQFNRIPAGEDGSLRDGFGGIEWTFVPDPGPSHGVLDQLLARMSRGQG